MSYILCPAVDESGQPCQLPANPSGFCHIHEPKVIAQQETPEGRPATAGFQPTSRRFSQRRGLKRIPQALQLDDMSQELRNSLWNVLSQNIFAPHAAEPVLGSVYHGKLVSRFVRSLWLDYFKNPLELLPATSDDAVRRLLHHFRTCEWYEAYDFLEMALNYFDDPLLVEQVNAVLERELSGYRFTGGHFAPITTGQEIETLEQALGDAQSPGVADHLARALALLSDKQDPDFKGSIRESLAAVDSLAETIAGKRQATLGDALDTLGASGRLLPALQAAFLNLFGYASGEGVLRYDLLLERDLTAADASFVLVSCTALIAYLKAKLHGRPAAA